MSLTRLLMHPGNETRYGNHADFLNDRFNVNMILGICALRAHSLDQSSVFLLFFAALIAKQYITFIANQGRTPQHLDKSLVVS